MVLTDLVVLQDFGLHVTTLSPPMIQVNLAISERMWLFVDTLKGRAHAGRWTLPSTAGAFEEEIPFV